MPTFPWFYRIFSKMVTSKQTDFQMDLVKKKHISTDMIMKKGLVFIAIINYQHQCHREKKDGSKERNEDRKEKMQEKEEK